MKYIIALVLYSLAFPFHAAAANLDLETDPATGRPTDVTANLAALASADPAFIPLKAFDLPPQPEKLVITTEGIVRLGELLAQSYLGPK